MYNTKSKSYSNVVGNMSLSSDDYGYKSEVSGIMEAYAQGGGSLIKDLESIITSPQSKESFTSMVMESMASSPLFTDQYCARNVFYGNYKDRAQQLLDNTLHSIATESVIWGYSPIVAYTPFFLKKQWIDCVFKDVVMTEIPKTPVVEFGLERRYLKDMEGNEYPLPEALYNDDLTKKLRDAATGLNFTADPIAINLCKNLQLINPTYIPGVIAGDKSVELTANMSISAVVMTINTVEYIVPTNITVDTKTHNFVKGDVTYTNAANPTITGTDSIVGKVDFVKGTLTVMSTTGVVTGIYLKGKVANRFNNRSLDVVRRVENIEEVMPESGPRLNSSITIEDAADALALQNIDVIADSVAIMGGVLANFEDYEIKQFLVDSFEAQKAGNAAGIKYNDIDGGSMITEGGFDAMPSQGYGYTPAEWEKSSRVYFERIIGDIKTKLRTNNIIIVAVAHPNLIRFLQDGINWVFSDDTQISGVKLSYNFGIFTSAQDRVHMITSMRLQESEGIRFIAIPLTPELITFKHYKYNVTIDRNYRNPVNSLTPNILCTQRTLTFEILPVSGLMSITGRELYSPESFLGVVKTETVTP